MLSQAVNILARLGLLTVALPEWLLQKVPPGDKHTSLWSVTARMTKACRGPKASGFSARAPRQLPYTLTYAPSGMSTTGLYTALSSQFPVHCILSLDKIEDATVIPKHAACCVGSLCNISVPEIWLDFHLPTIWCTQSNQAENCRDAVEVVFLDLGRLYVLHC